EAAIALGLFTNETESLSIMREACANLCSPSQLRFLFTQILLNLPCPATQMFTEFQRHLSEDYLDTGLGAGAVTQLLLQDLNQYLQAGGSRLSQFGIPDPLHHCITEIDTEETFFTPMIRAGYRADVNHTLPQLNPEQR